MNAKKVLAKLLSQEDLTVVESISANTASFNTETRVLTLPKNDQLTEGYILHEVGHAMYTPPIIGTKNLKKYGSLINVLEDARIERKIKTRYPGSINKFKKMYDALEPMLVGKDVTSLKLIDKLNVSAKSNVNHQLNFNDEELVFLERMNKTSSFDDVVKLSEDIKNYLQEIRKLDNKKQQESEESEESEEPESEKQEQESEQESEQEQESEDNKQQLENDYNQNENSLTETSSDENSLIETSSDETSLIETSSDETSSSETSDVLDDLMSETQDFLDNNNKQIIEEGVNKNSNEFFIGKNESIKTTVIKPEEFFDNENKEELSIALNYKKDEVDELLKSIKKTGTYMAAQFERQKKADEMSRTSVSNKGTLNTRRLYLSKISDDIFNTIETLKDGKSHGVQLLVDFSGSMFGSMIKILEQAVLVIDFCQKTNIPYEVYGFTTSFKRENFIDPKDNEENYLFGAECLLYLIASNKLTKKQNDFSVEWMLRFGYFKDYDNIKTRSYGTFYQVNKVRLGGTPINQSLLMMNNLTAKFKSENKIQVPNILVFTDGDDSHSLITSKKKYKSYFRISEKNEKCRDEFSITDIVTRKTYKSKTEDEILNIMFDVLQERHGANITFLKMGNLAKLENHIYQNGTKVDQDFKSIRANKYIKMTDNSKVTTILMKDENNKKKNNKNKNVSYTKASFKRAMKDNKDSHLFANLIVDSISKNFV